MALLAELLTVPGMMELRKELPRHKIENLLYYQTELKKKPEERGRVKADKALDDWVKDSGLTEFQADGETIDLTDFTFN